MTDTSESAPSASDAVWEAMLGLGPMASDLESFDEKTGIVRLKVGATPGTITARAFRLDDLWRLPYGIARPSADRHSPLPADLAHTLLGRDLWKVTIGLRTGAALPRKRAAGLVVSRSADATWAMTERLTATNTWVGEVGGDLRPDIELPVKVQRLILLEWCRRIATTEIYLSRAMRGPNRKSTRKARKAAGGARKDRRAWARQLRRGRSEIEMLIRGVATDVVLSERPAATPPGSRRIAPEASIPRIDTTDIFGDSVIELARNVAYGDETALVASSTSISKIGERFREASDYKVVLHVAGDQSLVKPHPFRCWCPTDRADKISVSQVDAEMLAFAIDAINGTLDDRLRKRSIIERAFGGIQFESASDDPRWLAELKATLVAENDSVSR